MKVFLDTNVIIDFCSARENFFHAAALLFQLSAEGEFQLLASATTFVNSFYILRKVYGREELYSRMKAIADRCVISPVDRNIIDKGLLSIAPDFEDAVQYYSAKSMQADIIVTRNKKHFVMARPGEVMTPDEFLDYYYSQR